MAALQAARLVKEVFDHDSKHRGRDGGFLAVAGLSLATDEVFHLLQVYPPWGVTMTDPRLYVLALSYRIVYTVLGGSITARLAPQSPMRHVMVLAIIGLIGGSAGCSACAGQGPPEGGRYDL